MKQYMLWIGIALFVISWIGNNVYFQAKQLDEPIFLQHYIAREMNDEEEELSLTLYYLTNKQEPLHVSYAEVDGVRLRPNDERSNGWFNEWGEEQKINVVQELNHQYLMSANLQLPMDEIPFGKKDHAWSFNHLTVHFTNGQQIKAHIGKAVIKIRNQEPSLLKETEEGSSMSHFTVKTFKALRQITINSLAISIPKIADQVSIKVGMDDEKFKDLGMLAELPEVSVADNTDWENAYGVEVDKMPPFILEEEDWLKIYVQYHPKQTSFFEFDITISGTTENGDDVELTTPITIHPELTDTDVTNIIKTKKAGEAK